MEELQPLVRYVLPIFQIAVSGYLVVVALRMRRRARALEALRDRIAASSPSERTPASMNFRMPPDGVIVIGPYTNVCPYCDGRTVRYTRITGDGVAAITDTPCTIH